MEVVEHTGEAQPTSPNQVVPDAFVGWGAAKRGEAGRGKAPRGAIRPGGAWRGEAGAKQGGAMWTLVDKMGNNET